MKLFIILIIVTVVAVQGLSLTSEQRAKAKQYHKECKQETMVNSDLVKKARMGEFVEDAALKKYALCFFRKANIITSDGKLNEEVALSKLPPGANREGAKKVIDHCKNTKGTDAADTAFKIYKCYYQTTPTHVSLV